MQPTLADNFGHALKAYQIVSIEGTPPLAHDPAMFQDVVVMAVCAHAVARAPDRDDLTQRFMLHAFANKDRLEKPAFFRIYTLALEALSEQAKTDQAAASFLLNMVRMVPENKRAAFSAQMLAAARQYQSPLVSPLAEVSRRVAINPGLQALPTTYC